MELKELEVRVYVLVGQLEEAKRMYETARREIDASKKQANEGASTQTTDSAQTISVGN